MKKFVVDGVVTAQDFKAVRARAEAVGWGQLVCEMLQNEPLLAEMVFRRWGRVKTKLEGMGLTETQTNSVMYHVGRMLVESIGVMQRSSRRLWDDLLPDDGNDLSK